jgi:predicted Zn-dependent protease
MALACFTSGLLVQTVLGQGGKPVFNAEQMKTLDAKKAASTMLETALQLAENGSWERIAVGRAYYLGGDKARGQQIFDMVTANNKAESSDWFRMGRVYAEAHEWDKAKTAFDKALSMKPNDDSGMIEYGGLANIQGERAKAEELFAKAIAKNSKEFWHWVNAGGSYLGVIPQ